MPQWHSQSQQTSRVAPLSSVTPLIGELQWLRLGSSVREGVSLTELNEFWSLLRSLYMRRETRSLQAAQLLALKADPNGHREQGATCLHVACQHKPELTRTPRGLRWVRTGYAYQPPALGTYRRRRAACPQGPAYCTYWVRVPASGVGLSLIHI